MFKIIGLLLAVSLSTFAAPLWCYPSALEKRSIKPSTTDPEIVEDDFWHTIYINQDLAPARLKLFVFLPGSGSTGGGYEYILQTAANLGIPAIGLTYSNSASISSICQSAADPDCHERVRIEVMTGANISGKITVDESHSIENRLAKLLAYLHENYSTERWDRFIDPDGNINWFRVVVGGHSQGAGHAALIARIYEVKRCLMFAWTDFSYVDYQIAPWVYKPSATPPPRYYGFTHVQDTIVPFGIERLTWSILGMDGFGSLVWVDSSEQDYTGSRMFATDLPSRGSTHAATVGDAATPLEADGQTPVFQDLWRYMLDG